MSIIWSLIKVAALPEDENIQNSVPTENINTENLTPQQPITPTPPTSPSGEVTGLLNWQKLNFKKVQGVISFVKRNLESVDDHASEVISYYKTDPYLWQTFEQAVKTLNPSESFESFVQRLLKGNTTDYEQPNEENGILIEESDPQLQTDVQNCILEMNEKLSDWIAEKGSEKSDYNSNQPTTVAAGIGGAVEHFFNKTSYGHVPNWMNFLQKNNLLPSSAISYIKELGVKNGINKNISDWYSENESLYPGLQTLLDLADEKDPRLLKELEISAAKSASNAVAGNSLDSSLGESGTKKDLIEDKKSANPLEEVMKVKDLSNNTITTGINLALSFKEENPQFTEELKKAVHPETKENLIASLIKIGKGTEEEILDSALKYPFIGKSYSQTKDLKTGKYVYTNTEEHNQWIEFFMDHPELVPDDVNPEDTDEMQDRELQLFPILANPKYKNLIKEYMGSPINGNGPSFNYLVYLYDINRTYDKSNLNKHIAGYGNIQDFNKLSNLTVGFLKRYFEAAKIQGTSVDTAALNYAVTEAKIKKVKDRLQQLLGINKKIKLNNKYYVYRDEKDQVVIAKDKGGGKWLVDPTKDNKCGPLNDNNIDMLVDLTSPQEYGFMAINKVAEIYPEALKKEEIKDRFKIGPDGKMLKDEKNKGIKEPKPPKVIKLEESYKKEIEDYRASHPDDKDILHGFRIGLARRINERAKELSKKLGAGENGIDEKDIPQFLYERSKKLLSNQGNKGRIGKDGKVFFENITSGKPQFYNESDFKNISMILNLTNEEKSKVNNLNEYEDKDEDDFMARLPYYDPYSYMDATALANASSRGSFRYYGNYLLHKKRESARRGMLNSYFTDKSLFLFLTVLGVPSSAANGNTPSEKPYGKMLYELVPGGKPISTDKPWSEISKKLEDAEYPINDLGEQDLYEQKLDKFPFSNNKKYYPSNVHPSNFEIREDTYDKDKGGIFYDRDEKGKLKKNGPQTINGKTLDQWKDEYVNNLNKKINYNPEKLQEELSNSNPVELAKKLIRDDYIEASKKNNKNRTEEEINKFVNSSFDRLLKERNQSNSKFGIEKQYSPEEFARLFVENRISTEKYFKDQAIKIKSKLDKKNLAELPPEEKYNLFVPAKIRRDKKSIAKMLTDNSSKRKTKALSDKEMQDLVNSDLVERYNSRIENKENPEQIAIDYIKEKKDFDNNEAIRFLNDKMKRYNTEKSKQGSPTVNSLSEYCLHYINESLKFENAYREKVKKYLENPLKKIEKGKEEKIPFPKLSMHELNKKIKKLSSVQEVMNKLSKYSKCDYSLYLNMVDSI